VIGTHDLSFYLMPGQTQAVLHWAVTDRPAAVEEELRRKYKEAFDRLPKYTDRT
jgi:hypothetical protein